MPPVLTVTNLRKTYGDFVAVDSVSFEVEERQVFGMLGPNGAGKSTTMMMVSGLLVPDSGTVTIDGQPLDRSNLELRKSLGVVPQELAIYPDLTARENLDFFARLYKVSPNDRGTRIDEALERIGLTDRADDLINEYSGGMKRRLNFAAALLHQPRLLILDEPTVGVDPQSRSHLLDSVRQLRDAGMSVIYVSHYMEEVEAICDRVAIMDQGKILACDGLQELLDRSTSELRLTVSGDSTNLADSLPEWATTTAMANDRQQIVVRRNESRTLQSDLKQIVQLIDSSDFELIDVDADPANLERLFLDLTGHALRD